MNPLTSVVVGVCVGLGIGFVLACLLEWRHLRKARAIQANAQAVLDGARQHLAAADAHRMKAAMQVAAAEQRHDDATRILADAFRVLGRSATGS